ncbi:MAG TPA: hypothetical protein VKU87_10070 [Thermomicrobiaceae bacterium]|nr:hypothetical protein [Thermomicrobiaceae bacterium]
MRRDWWNTDQPSALIAGRILGIVTLLAILIGMARATPALAVQAKPATDWSFYVRYIDPNPGDDYPQAYNLGCNQGHFDASYGQNSEVVLDFGAQDFSGAGGSPGTRLTVVNTFEDYSQISGYAERFAFGYYYCTGTDTTTTLHLGIGTNNSTYNFDRVDYGGGEDWATEVNNIANDVANQGESSQVVVFGASDMELDWHDAASTINWVNGYQAQTSNHLLNFGDAAGCPPSGGCDNQWTVANVYYVSWGDPIAYSLPEIYYSTNAQQWQNISLYGVTSGQSAGKIVFDGPLDQYDLCPSSNTSDQAWNQLWTDINQDSRTASSLTYSAEMHTSNGSSGGC